MKRLIGMILFCTFVYSGMAYADINDGLIAYWPFNGNANDESGNGNHGTVYGPTLTYDMVGNPDCAYSFDGMDDHITVPDSDSLDVTNGITIAAWINIEPRPHGGDHYIVDSREGYNQPGYFMNVDLNHAGLGTPKGPGGFGIVVPDGEWHHLAGTYDGVTTIIYLDGMSVGNAPCGLGFTQSTATLMIGTYYGGPAGEDDFHGIMDELRIYNRALPLDEIEELVRETGPPCDADYNDDGVVDREDRIKKRADLMREARKEFRDWVRNCWLPEHAE